MRLTQIVANDSTLLNYAMITNPDPLGVGSTAILTFVVSAQPLAVQPDPVLVAQIIFSLPVGNPSAPDPTDLTDTPPPASCATISSSGTDVWTIAPGTADGVFVATPPNNTPIVVGSQGLTVMFSGIAVSALVGTAEIDISEWATTGSTPPPTSGDPSGTLSVAVPKFPAGFYAGNFKGLPPEVQNGSAATLTWIGSPGTYKIYSGVAAPVDVSTVRSWSTGSLTDATSFVLEASAQEGGQTVYLYFNTTIMVADPSIVANDVTVLTTSTLNGAVNVGTSATPAALTVAGLLTADAGITATGSVSAGTLSATGAANVGSLSTGGQVTANSVQANSLNATSATLGSTGITGLTANQGTVAALGAMQAISPGTWQTPNAFYAPTDGFVFGTILGPSNYPTGGCMCWAAIQSQGVTIYGTGGNVGYFGPDWDDCMGNNFTSLMMPVAANNYFYLALQQDTGDCQQTSASYSFYFMPIGAGSASSSVEEAPDAPKIEIPAVGDKLRRYWDAPGQFVTVLETLLAKPIDPATRQQLIDVLHRM